MAPDVAAEIQSFIRWLALMPEYFRTYRQDPETIYRTAQLSPATRAALTEAGIEAVSAEVRRMAEEIVEDPASWEPTNFTRNVKAKGYGARPEH